MLHRHDSCNEHVVRDQRDLTQRRWQLDTEVSGEPVGHNLKGQDRSVRLSRNVGKKLPSALCINHKRAQKSFTPRLKTGNHEFEIPTNNYQSIRRNILQEVKTKNHLQTRKVQTF